MPGARLSLEERERISRGLAAGQGFAELGRHLGRPTSTVSREVGRNGGAQHYRAVRAQRAARRRARRPKVRKLVADYKLAQLVGHKLKRRWSPQQIAAYLRQRYAEPHKRVSHETIYQCLYLQGRGGLRAELRKALRTGRAQRRLRDRERKTPTRIADMVMISERPAEIEDRAVPGHWEGDLIIGKDSKSQVGTLVERSTRFVMLVRLPNDRSAHTVRKAIARKITHLPQALKRSLTWDQGTEMADTFASLWLPACRCTSATDAAPGNAVPTRIPTVYCVSTCPRAWTCPCSATTSSIESPMSSTPALVRLSDG